MSEALSRIACCNTKFTKRIIGVSFAIEGRGGPARVKISREMMPLSEFLNIFGLSLQDVKNYLDE